MYENSDYLAKQATLTSGSVRAGASVLPTYGKRHMALGILS